MCLTLYLIVASCTTHIKAVDDILQSDKLQLFSNGVLQYFVAPEQDVLCSILDGLGCGGRDVKPTKIQIHLSRNLQVHRQDDTTLQIIDIITNNPLTGFPGHFRSKLDLIEWEQQLLSIVRHTSPYKRSLGISLKDKVYLTYSGSRIFFGVVVFIGDIRDHGTKHAQRPFFAIKVSPQEMFKANLKHHMDATMFSDGVFGGIRYFNYMGNTEDTFIIMDSSQIFQSQQCLGTDPVTQRVRFLGEAKDFFIITMPQILQVIEGELNGQDIAIPGSEYMLHIDEVDLSRVTVRLFNYESQRSLSNPTFKAKVKAFGDVNIALHVRTAAGRQYSKSDVRITRLFVGGVINVNYQFTMRDSKQQVLRIGFLRKPVIELSKMSNVAQFPNELMGKEYFNVAAWLEYVTQTILERRGSENMISWSIGSPYD